MKYRTISAADKLRRKQTFGPSDFVLLPLLADVVEAAQAATRFARGVDLNAAVIQGGSPDLRESLERLYEELGEEPA